RRDETESSEIPRDQRRREDTGEDGREKIPADFLPPSVKTRSYETARERSARNQTRNSDDTQLVSQVEYGDGNYEGNECADGERCPWRGWPLRRFRCRDHREHNR